MTFQLHETTTEDTAMEPVHVTRSDVMQQRWRLSIPALALLIATACLRLPTIEIPEEVPLSSRTRILAADGSLLATLFVENREPIAFEELPRALIDAVVAAEDQRFWSHRGFDAKSMIRAALRNAAEGRTVQGASTITQQYVKNTYFPIDRSRTLEQKVREIQIAFTLEQRHSKRELLERYLNTVYFGEGAYGVKAAAEQFLAKPVEQLSLEEAALMAGLIRSPETDNPRRNPDGALARRSYVLSRMLALGMISEIDAAEASNTEIGLADPPALGVREPHWVEYVKQAVLRDPAFGLDEAERASFLFRSGAEFTTSLEPRLQEAARESIKTILGRPGDPEVALVAIQPRTGRIVAMVGGRDFNSSQVNLALGALGGGSGRQSGSAFKPFVLSAAIEKGILPSAIYSSSPPTIRISRGEVWRPSNYDGRGHGSMSVEVATINSVNAVYARLGMDVGPARVMGMAQRMGITSPLRPMPSISLGTMEVSPLEMASAFGTLANYGMHVAPTSVIEVRLSDGNVLTQVAKMQRALDPGTAWLVTDALTKVIIQGTGRRARLDRPAAGKTGTTEDIADAWFVGYTPSLVAAVWVGYPSGRIPMTNIHGLTVVGGTFPAMIWRAFMERALADVPPEAFVIPSSDLIEVEIDPNTGQLAGPNCAARQTVQMLRQLAPRTTCAPQPESSPTSSPESSPSPGPESPSPEPSPTPSSPASEASPTPTPSPSPTN